MKMISMFYKTAFLFAATMILSASMMQAQSSKDKQLISDSKKAKTEFLKGDKLMQTLFNNSYGYVVFPNMGKGGAGVGAAAGTGVVYEKGKIIGTAKMTQLNVGAQLGGQAYREVIFFETKAALDRFRQNKFEFAAQTSAVAVNAGASADVKYRDGVLVFTQEKMGLMYEASVGGQKFNYTSF